jgi:hypothetical protein
MSRKINPLPMSFIFSFFSCWAQVLLWHLGLTVIFHRIVPANPVFEVARFFSQNGSAMDVIRNQCANIHSLCSAFLGIKETLDPGMKRLFQQTGLVHLISISSGQMRPLLTLATVCLGVLLMAAFLNQPKGFVSRIAWLPKLRWWSQFLLSAGLAFQLGLTGALCRLPFVSHWEVANSSAKSIPPQLFLWSLLFVLSSLLGNVLSNASFVLSSLGAGAAILSYEAAKLLFDKSSMWIRGVATSLMTTALVSCILSPYGMGGQFWIALAANTLAVPLAGWVLAPLCLVSALLWMFGNQWEFLNLTLTSSLEALVSWAKFCESVFYTSEIHSSSSFAAFQHALKSQHFTIVLVLVWSILDGKKLWEQKKLQELFLTKI